MDSAIENKIEGERTKEFFENLFRDIPIIDERDAFFRQLEEKRRKRERKIKKI